MSATQGLKVALVEPKATFGAPTGIHSKVLREVAIEYGEHTTWDRVVDTCLCTVIGNDQSVTVGTIEHLLAALAGLLME